MSAKRQDTSAPTTSASTAGARTAPIPDGWRRDPPGRPAPGSGPARVPEEGSGGGGVAGCRRHRAAPAPGPVRARPPVRVPTARGAPPRARRRTSRRDGAPRRHRPALPARAAARRPQDRRGLIARRQVADHGAPVGGHVDREVLVGDPRRVDPERRPGAAPDDVAASAQGRGETAARSADDPQPPHGSGPARRRPPGTCGRAGPRPGGARPAAGPRRGPPARRRRPGIARRSRAARRPGRRAGRHGEREGRPPAHRYRIMSFHVNTCDCFVVDPCESWGRPRVTAPERNDQEQRTTKRADGAARARS